MRQYVSCRALINPILCKSCIKINLEEWFKYNDMVKEGTNNLRCLGKVVCQMAAK